LIYIERVYISGYGIFSDCSLPDKSSGDGLSRKLTIVVGDNESGKTTLLSFIRTILFGFPVAKVEEDLYPPLAGGRHGGRITFVNNQGERYVVERFAGKSGGPVSITLPDGPQGGATDLSELLGHASKDLFRNVFAFSLRELQEFRTLARDEVKSRIYSAGLGTGRLSLHEIELDLERKRSDLFTTTKAPSKHLAKLLEECSQTRQRLRDLANQSSKYEKFRAELRSLSQEIDKKRKEHREKVTNLNHILALKQSWEVWTDLQSAKKELSNLPNIRRFPTDGLARLEGLNARIRATKENVERAQHERELGQSKLDGIQVNEALLRQKHQIVELERGLARYESARKDLPELKIGIEAGLEDLKKSFSDLGPGWDEERVLGFDTSIPARQTLRSHIQSLAAKNQALHDSRRTVGEAVKRLAAARKDLERREATFGKLLEPSERDRAALEERLQTARELQIEVTSYLSLTQELAHYTERYEDKKSYKATMERQLLESAEGFRISTILTVALLLLPIVGWLILLHLRRESARQIERREGIRNDMQSLERDLQELDGRIVIKKKQSDKDVISLKEIAGQLHFDDIPSLGDIGALISNIQDKIAELSNWQQAKRQVDDAAEVVMGADKDVQEGEAFVKKAEYDLHQAQEFWSEWRQANGIGIDCSPETALELLSKLEATREKIKNLGIIRDRLSAVENAVKKYEDSANAILEYCGQKRRPQAEFPRVVYSLLDEFRKTEKDAEFVRQVRESIEGKKSDEDSFREELIRVEHETKELLSEADAANEEEFRSRAKIVEKREQLQAMVGNCTKNLEMVAGLGEALESFMGELEETIPEKLDERNRLMEDQIDRDDKELEEMQNEWGRLDLQVKEMEKEEEASALRLRLNVLQENLRVHALEWSTLTIAVALLREARAKYERERKPDVVLEGQVLFSMITSGRYPRLISPPGESQIHVEDQNGQRTTLSQLSRGTAEQLYLALRFGLIKEFSRRSEALPVIMDDILVNFDPQRAELACRAIGELAEKNQVILFTCHPETVKLLRAQVPNCMVVELPK
jgi:uncharacterized protein YhaN